MVVKHSPDQKNPMAVMETLWAGQPLLVRHWQVRHVMSDDLAHYEKKPRYIVFEYNLGGIQASRINASRIWGRRPRPTRK